jgi:uncharacterized membrane protein YbhN (UPF0104 family)
MPGFRQGLYRWGAVAVLCGLLAAAVVLVDLKLVLALLAKANLFQVLVVLPLLIIAVWAVKTARWLLVLRAFGIVAAPGSTYLAVAAALGLAIITPMQSGEALKLAHAKAAHNVEVAKGLGGLAAERVLDLLAVALMTLGASALLLHGRYRDMLLALVAGLLGACALLAVAGWVFQLPSRLRDGLDGFAAIGRRPVLLCGTVGLTVLSWLLTAKLWQAAMASVGVEVPAGLTVLVMGLVMLATVASMLPGGAGVSDAAAVVILTQHGFSAEQGVAAALALRFITVLAIVLGLGHGMAAGVTGVHDGGAHGGDHGQGGAT